MKVGVYTCMLNLWGDTKSNLSPLSQTSAFASVFEGDGFYLAVGRAVAQHNWFHITTLPQCCRTTSSGASSATAQRTWV